ncbi:MULTISPECIES: helix-turn-helix transcriptional regulator [Paenibacillus]|uniref:HTH luxR-type domain-containing protein n=1 Tax=Paenibacillus azoreducens TaxID=116718 RepID=A0A919YA64_9BACL|nr:MULTISPECIES: response regulator transcription factor [Paenibacillus]MBE9916058.1 response regulator transcription factor [Paenibacillus donghaensis]GIO46664.1 hypothetical protein J34TS1_14290 [Paenibacillus azoreducens]
MNSISVMTIGVGGIFLWALQNYLKEKDNLKVTSCKYKSEQSTIEAIRVYNPHVLIFEFDLEICLKVSFMNLKSTFPNLKIILLAIDKNYHLYNKNIGGIDAFLTKEVEISDIYKTITMVYSQFKISNLRSSENSLSSQEQKVLECITLGLSNKEIAKSLHICNRTVSYYISNIFYKLDASNRAQAVLKGILKGYVKHDIIQQMIH